MKEQELLEKILKISKLLLIVLICILIVLTIGVSKMYSSNMTNTNTDTNSDSEYNTNYDVSMFEEINASDIGKKTKGKMQVVYVGRETCGWCAAFLPALWQAQEDYDYTTLYIDIAKIIDFNTNSIIDENSYNIMMKLTGTDYDGYMEENFGATPMVLIIKDGKIIEAQTGYSEYDTFKTLLKNAGY